MMTDRGNKSKSGSPPRPSKGQGGEDEGSAPVEGNDEGLKEDQKPVDH